MTQRRDFLADHRRQVFTMTELCARYGVSRKTGYKWLARYEAGGLPGLADRSRAPQHCPHRLAGSLARLLCQARRTHPSWGPRKLLQYLVPRHLEIAGWPAASTVGDLFARRGLIPKRRRRRSHQHPGVVPPLTRAPNDLWTADFKGEFRTGDGIYCYPFTLADQHTRYLLACQGMASTKGVPVRGVLERAFRTYGLPRAIRTDNGVPFATGGIHGLSQLTVWWIRLGIQHQRIRPASPQQNAAHERMHKTLKAGALRPPKATAVAQQRAFNTFRREYNEVRPHEFLAGATPASRYQPSARDYPARLPAIEYPTHFVIKRITNAGTFRFQHKLLFLSNALKQLPVGLEEVDDGLWSIYFCTVLLARLDERDYTLRD
jgi:transposase InsO family protein